MAERLAERLAAPAFSDPADAPDRIKEIAWKRAFKRARKQLAPDEVAKVEAMDEAATEAELATELRIMKRRSESEFNEFLSLLPSDDRANVERILRDHGV